MTIAKEEIFGPVLSVFKFSNLDKAIQQANESNYGLASAVFSENVNTCHYVARKLQAGTCWINCYEYSWTGCPFGGFKQSGFGRENCKETLKSFTEMKSVVLKFKN